MERYFIFFGLLAILPLISFVYAYRTVKNRRKEGLKLKLGYMHLVVLLLSLIFSLCYSVHLAQGAAIAFVLLMGYENSGALLVWSLFSRESDSILDFGLLIFGALAAVPAFLLIYLWVCGLVFGIP